MRSAGCLAAPGWSLAASPDAAWPRQLHTQRPAASVLAQSLGRLVLHMPPGSEFLEVRGLCEQQQKIGKNNRDMPCSKPIAYGSRNAQIKHVFGLQYI